MASTTREIVANPEPVNSVPLMSGKPLHRFVQRDPRSFGIVVLVFGCAELLIGLQITDDCIDFTDDIYIPFWQGVLFAVCGVLSIYTGVHPSKKMVTVCLSMYVVSLLGIILSIGWRISCISHIEHVRYWESPFEDETWAYVRINQKLSIEAILLSSSLCVSGILIFLSVVARVSLKSTNTQVFLMRAQAAQ